jgi:uncharacterized protein (DUF488 family)
MPPRVAQFTVYSVGHGLLSWEQFAALLEPLDVEMIVDVRAYPYVEAVPWFNRDRLEHMVRRAGWEYLWLGGQLGALTMDGRLDYVSKEKDPRYREGILELMTMAHERQVCLLSAQADPQHSHRHHLIAQTLIRHDVRVLHILHDGGLVQAQPDLFHNLR